MLAAPGSTIRVAQGRAGCHQAVGAEQAQCSPGPTFLLQREEAAGQPVHGGASPQAGPGCSRSVWQPGLGGLTPGRLWHRCPLLPPCSQSRAMCRKAARGRGRDLSPLRALAAHPRLPCRGEENVGRSPCPIRSLCSLRPGAPTAGLRAPRPQAPPGRPLPLPPRPSRLVPGRALTRWSQRPRGAGTRGQVQVRPRRPSRVPARSPSRVQTRSPPRPAGALLSPWPRHPNFVHSRRAGSFRASRTLGWVSAATSELGNKEGESRPGRGRKRTAGRAAH